MPSWSELLSGVSAQPDQAAKDAYIQEGIRTALEGVGRLRGGRNVIIYASAFLQKPAAPFQLVGLTNEDIHGLMATVYQMDCTKGLTLLMHTPGGQTNATETFVDYLWSKFTDIEVIVPTFAMSAGTMISLAANRIVMGRQSQLGPIDPQMPSSGRPVSAWAVLQTFERARAEIAADKNLGHLWAPVLTTMGPALLQDCDDAIEYSERLVATWLSQHMFAGSATPVEDGKRVARHFGDAKNHKSHGRRIGRDEARQQGLVVEDLENNQDLQDAVLTAYHFLTLVFAMTAATKVVTSSHGSSWIKNQPPEPKNKT